MAKKKKKLAFKPTKMPKEPDRGVTSDIWLCVWGVIAIFIIVVLVLYFTGWLGGAFGITGKAVQVDEQRACLKGNAVTSHLEANRFIAAGYVCDEGLIPGILCCYIP